jgi:tungstate transport system substrate-binding protein
MSWGFEEGKVYNRRAAAKRFADWLVSPEGQQAIGAYQVNGQKLFNSSTRSPK